MQIGEGTEMNVVSANSQNMGAPVFNHSDSTESNNTMLTLLRQIPGGQ